MLRDGALGGRALLLGAGLALLAMSGCGDDSSSAGAGGASGTGSNGTGPNGTGTDGTGASGAGGDAPSGAGGGETEVVGEALVALLSVEAELFEIDIEGDPFAVLALGEGSGAVFVTPIFDCGVGLGTCVEVFREGFTEPTELAVEDGGTVVHFFVGAAGEDDDVTTDEVIPDPGLGETAVVVRSFIEGPTLTLSAPSGTLNPLASGVGLVPSGQEVVLVRPDQTIVETGIVLEEGSSYAITADNGSAGGFVVVVCLLEDGTSCESYVFTPG